MAAPKFDMDRAARDWVEALRRLQNGNRNGGELDDMDRIAAAVDNGSHYFAFLRAVTGVAADALDALEARPGAANG